MNQHDDVRGRDHGWVDPAGTDILAQTLGAMAAGVDPESPTGPVAALPVMARRVRRRRTAKVGGLSGGALALAAVLVLGATQLAPTNQSEPLPGTSSTSPSPSASPEIELREGYQPELLAGTPLECGANIADLELSQDIRLAPVGDLSTESSYYEGEWYTSTSLPLRAADAAGADASEDDLNEPSFVWVAEDGTVVALSGWADYPMGLAHEEGGPRASEDGTSECAPEGADQWLPDGTYEAYPMSIEFSTGTLVAGDPIEAEIVDGEPMWAPGGQEAPVPFDVPGDPDETLVPDRGLGSVVVDRTGPWERWVTYRAVWPDSELTVGENYVLQARCTSSDPSDRITYELLGLWGSDTVTGEIACDGQDRTDGPWGYQPPGHPTDPVGVRLTDVPDGVALAYVRLVPETSAGG